jgi:hypothetical protein
MKGRVYYAINSEGCGLFEWQFNEHYTYETHLARLLQEFRRLVGDYHIVKIELDYAGG